jgi:hypothetical protein
MHRRYTLYTFSEDNGLSNSNTHTDTSCYYNFCGLKYLKVYISKKNTQILYYIVHLVWPCVEIIRMNTNADPKGMIASHKISNCHFTKKAQCTFIPS